MIGKGDMLYYPLGGQADSGSLCFRREVEVVVKFWKKHENQITDVTEEKRLGAE